MARRVFDPKLAISFHAVVEAGSITAGAIACGVTQPWMSEQVRKLEDQLGGQLLVRTSRSLALTDLGREFLPHARALASANADAQVFAASLLEGRSQALDIGACQYSAGLPQRAQLVEQLVRRHPQIRVMVRQGRSIDLVETLLAGGLDLVMVHQLGLIDRPEIEHLLLIQRYGFLMMRDDDPLAGLEMVPFDQLAGRQLFIGPGRDDPVSMHRSLQPLVEAGMVLVPCPDTDRSVIENLAMESGGLCVAWEVTDAPREPTPGRLSKRLAQGGIFSPIALARRASEMPSRPVRLAWEIAGEMSMIAGRAQNGCSGSVASDCSGKVPVRWCRETNGGRRKD